MAIKYLAGNRLWGTNAERLAMTTESFAQTSWKVIDSDVLTTAGDTLDCNGSGSGFGNYDNIMFIFYRNSNGSGNITFNGDDAGSNANYSRRYSYNGGLNGTSTQTGLDGMNVYLNTDYPNFIVGNFRNIDGECKVITTSGVETVGGNATTAPNRSNQTTKWSGTDRITRIKITSSPDMASGTELIVLGSNDAEADSGTNFWQELGNDSLDSTGDDMSVTLSEQKKYLWVNWFCKQYVSGSTETNTQMKFNGITDHSDLIARRIWFSSAPSSDTLSADQDNINFADGSIGSMSGSAFIYNKSDEIKLIIFFLVKARDGDYQPTQNAGVAIWNKTDTAITSVDLHNTGTGAYDIGSNMRVFGGEV